jgi:hypothetical protein
MLNAVILATTTGQKAFASPGSVNPGHPAR